MASDTVSAAIPGPADPPDNTTQQPRGLAGLLSAVDPARPTDFTLHPTTETTSTEDTVAGGSSADYHHTPSTETTNNSTSNTTGNKNQSVIRAWFLAGAERWRKGADARNKALDIQKARAQALKVTESRTINRSEKIAGGSTNTGTDTRSSSGKSLDNKTRNHNSGNSAGGANHSSRSNHRGDGSGGRSNSGGGGGRGSSGRDTNSNSSSRRHSDGPHDRSRSNAQHRDGRRDGSGSGSSNGSWRSPNSGGGSGQGSRGGAGQPGPKGPSGGRGGGSSPNSGPKPAQTNSGTPRNPNSPPPTRVHSPGDNSGRPWKTEKTPDAAARTKTPGGPNQPRTNTQTKPGQTTVGPDLTKRPQTTPTPNTTPLKTQGSRETGYRDGTRAATAANHVIAYRDGVRDGWNDERDRGRREAAHLDQAHAKHKQQQEQEPAKAPGPSQIPPRPTVPPTVGTTQAPGSAEKLVSLKKPDTKPETKTPPKPIKKPATTPTKTAPDTTPTKPKTPKEPDAVPNSSPAPAQQLLNPKSDARLVPPINVTHIDATHLRLGAGADRQYISRGEVRTLKSYERALDEKNWSMTNHAEKCKALKEHAIAQAKRAAYLLEATKRVEGGSNLLAKLTKLAEEANNQLIQAEELYKRSIRGAEASKVLRGNVATRYGDMYRAVVNSPETTPAELSFYKG
ncbi:hypothetical protein SGPA1_80125 [Streptomyces misionensis JCM 4497]